MYLIMRFISCADPIMRFISHMLCVCVCVCACACVCRFGVLLLSYVQSWYFRAVSKGLLKTYYYGDALLYVLVTPILLHLVCACMWHCTTLLLCSILFYYSVTETISC